MSYFFLFFFSICDWLVWLWGSVLNPFHLNSLYIFFLRIVLVFYLLCSINFPVPYYFSLVFGGRARITDGTCEKVLLDH